MAIAYYIPQSHHQHQHQQQSENSSSTSPTMNSSASTITIPINQGGSNTCWEFLAKVFCFALRFCHQTPSQGVLRITFECQTTSQSSTTTTSENTNNKFKN